MNAKGERPLGSPPFIYVSFMVAGARCGRGASPHLEIPAARSALSDLVSAGSGSRGASSVPSCPFDLDRQTGGRIGG